MSANLAEYAKIQRTILQHLFDKGTRVSVADIEKLIGKGASETEYHIDQLRNRGHIAHDNYLSGGQSVRAYSITETGRKLIMES